MIEKKLIFILSMVLNLFIQKGCGGRAEAQVKGKDYITTGPDQVDVYLPFPKGKRVGMVVNQTYISGDKQSVDSRHALGVNIRVVFGPEHGFRANASNGAEVHDEVDAKTGIPIVSLYGKKRTVGSQYEFN